MESRGRAPRSSHGDWAPAADRPDPIDVLRRQGETRVAELLPIRYGRMLASPFAFYRGAAAIMAADLAATPTSGIRVQLCGDAHVANFGGFASPERDMVFDINDFDETLPGPWEWDLKRLAASLEVAGRERGFSRRKRRTAVHAGVREYHRAMGDFAAMGNIEVGYSLLDLAGVRRRWGGELRPRHERVIEGEFEAGRDRDNMRAFEKLTTTAGGRLRFVARPPLLVPLEDIAGAEEARVARERLRSFLFAYAATLPAYQHHLITEYEIVDLARKVVGIGSVGTRTWVLLLLGRDEHDPLVLQVKEAQASVLEAHLGPSAYGSHGHRVVAGQQMMQAAHDQLLGWDRIQAPDGVTREHYVRQLWDWKVSPDLNTMSPSELVLYGQMCGWTLARAHARTGDRIAIAAYMGRGLSFVDAVAAFAALYADQNERDLAALRDAVAAGRVEALAGV